MISHYYDEQSVRERVQSGQHREVVGGLWEEIGTLTFNYLATHGLTPRSRVLDVGCGCLRVGVHLVDFLEPGNYYGLDLSQALLEVGYDVELRHKDLQWKLPRQNLLCDADFDFGRFPGRRRFDVAVAQSLFTHLPLNHLKLCLANLALHTTPEATLFATVFLCPDDRDWTQPLHHRRGGRVSFPARDPYHFRFAGTEGLPWTVQEPVDWNHPRGQSMVTFSRSALASSKHSG